MIIYKGNSESLAYEYAATPAPQNEYYIRKFSDKGIRKSLQICKEH